jgi:YHS domain-containing protein
VERDVLRCGGTALAIKVATYGSLARRCIMANPVDPVCGMELTPGQIEAQARYKGQGYYFCSEQCRRIFEEKPEEYVGNTGFQGDQSTPTPR